MPPPNHIGRLMAKRFLSTINLPKLSSDPGSGSEGEIYYNTTSDKVRFYNGSAWADLTSSGGGGASDSFTTISTPSGTSPVADSSSDTLNLTASNGLSITGDSSTDSVAFSTNATALNTASTIVSRDSDQAFDITGIDFDTVDTITSAVGRLSWDDGEGTLSLGLKGGNVNLSIGQENIALCYNGTGSTINKGSVVYISGAQGQRPSISLSDADTEATSSKTFGVVAENISNGAEGYVCTFGIVSGIDTSLFTAGQSLWLSSTAGGLTNTVPTQPVHAVFIGYCLHSHASSGRIFVNPQNGYELQELHNVLISNPLNTQALTYESSSGLWKNTSIDYLPSQTGNSGKYLTTNGSATSWSTISGAVYSADAPTSPVVGQIWIESDVDVTSFDPQIQRRWTRTLTGTESVFSGTSNGVGLSYVPGLEQVFLNGSLLVRTDDYTATNGTSVTLITAGSSGDVIEIISPVTIAFADIYSKTESNSLLALKANLASPALTGVPTAPTASAATNTTQIATTAFVRTEVSNLVASAPAALDTLDELAAALGDDANFATTVTNSLSAKAPLASPTFTGTVILPSDTSIGTISSTELGYIDGVTSSIQTQLNSKASTGKAIAMAMVFGG